MNDPVHSTVPPVMPHAQPPQWLLGVGMFLMTNLSARGPISHRPWLLELYTEGCLEVDVEHTGWRTCPAGTGILFPPGAHYVERVQRAARRSARCTSIALFFDMTGDAALARRLGRPLCHRFIDDMDGLLQRLAATILQHHGHGESGDLMAHGCFEQTLAALALAEQTERMERSGQASSIERRLIVREAPPAPADLVTTVHHYMRRHLAEPVRLFDIAEHVGMSESGLSHAYRRLAGQSPMAALQRMRIEAARTYLLSNRLSLSQIAERTGFADAFHLSRTFKKIVGLSPRMYREQGRPMASASPRNRGTRGRGGH